MRATGKYVFEAERGAERPAVFQLRSLSAEVKEWLRQNPNPGDRGLRLALKDGVVGWTDAKDKDGKPLPYSPNTDLMEHMTEARCAELGHRIVELTHCGRPIGPGWQEPEERGWALRVARRG